MQTRTTRIQPRQAHVQKRKGRHPLLVGVILLCLTIGVFRLIESHASAASSKITAGANGYCLDDHDNSTHANNTVDVWKCNDSNAQGWTANGTTITHDNTYCLSVQGSGKAQGTNVVLNACNNTPGQVWLRDNGGYENPNSTLCLAAQAGSSALIINSCATLSSSQETWTPTGSTSQPCTGSEGNKVACYAEKEWSTWQSSTPNHETLLNTYTDGAPYEEWCADFVSYIYKEAGYPFTQGEANGWDESNANNVQNMDFTMHMASSGYIPKPGDVAYFDYNGGHVEIVVSGGKTPTFIYGNSGTIDPTTGNGEMEANTITNAGGEGQLIYYLTPN
jgi:hypothetical protein